VNAIVADGVNDIFNLVGLDKPNIGLLSPESMLHVAKLEEKNLAVDLLERLLCD
jgi:type I restriction enzyme R subunit